MQSVSKILLLSIFLFILSEIQAQVTPIAVTGFNHDAIAEGAPNSLNTTTLQVDGGSSNKVMYTNAFRTFAGIAGGGLPDNGTITSGGDTYQLANYTGNNALYVKRNETFGLTVTTPSSFARIRILAFTTEGASSLNVILSFTDGTTSSYLSGYSLSDWFNGTTNLVLQGFGRCDRSTGPIYNADAYPSNPRMYYIDVPLTCIDKPKLLQTITFSNVSTFPNNAPFPNAVILGVSGIVYSQNIVPVITASNCNGPNGSISLSVSGSTSPYSYTWNTTPVQTGPIATGLAPGSYTCTITDAAGCITTYNGIVPLNNNGIIAATASPSAVCSNSPITTLTANVILGVFTNYVWQPGNLIGQNVVVSPTTTTTYTVTATNSVGCSKTSQVVVTVNPGPAFGFANNTSICPGDNVTLQIQNPENGVTYEWYDAATGGTLLGTGISFSANNITAATTFYIQSVSSFGCTAVTRYPVTVSLNIIPAAPSANSVSACVNDNVVLSVLNPQAGYIYNWFNTATGGSSIASGSSYTINNINTSTTIYVSATNTSGCSSSTRTPLTVSLLQQLPQPFAMVTNISFTSLTFSWNAVPGASGYEITTNGGATYQIPSSGAQGITHTINGLAGNTTVTFQVRALKNLPCETSLLSAPISGTTLTSKEIFVPNVFTPNGDGRNDVLLVFGNYVASIQMRIFNQWGQLIFSADNINTGWNGMYNGQQQPIGVYAYTLKVVLQDGTIVNKKGSINLIR